MKIIEKTLLACVLVLILFFSTGCSKIIDYQKSIYNDTSKISSVCDSYSFASRTGNNIYNNFAISFQGFNGKQTIWELTVKENSRLVIDCNTEIRSGIFKICLINEAGDVSTIAEGNKAEELTIGIEEGANYIAIIGKEAKGELKMTLTGNDRVSVKPIRE